MLPVFAAAIFLSATLLFLVQPMVGKMVLPVLGGTPAVWNTCMVFFQVLLLIGYLYAHLLTRYFKPLAQALVHSVVVLLPLLVLPIALPQGLNVPDGAFPLPWLLGVLGSLAAAPFLVLSTTGPLVQRWFAATDHRLAKDPYFLYAASNAGSLLALLAYPTVVEPLLRVRQQTSSWSIGYLVLAVLLIGCAVFRVRRARAETPAEAQSDPIATIPASAARGAFAWRERGVWVMLAFAPSSLMLGATTYLSTDVAPVPLLWIIPLAMYLVTMILAYGRAGPVATRAATIVLPFAMMGLMLLMLLGTRRLAWMHVPAHLVVLLVGAMACHGRLAERRPEPRRLTEYFLLVSLGGALGGVFNAIVAPLVFDRILEYPIALLLTGAIALSTIGPGPLLPRAWQGLVPKVPVWLVSIALGGLLLATSLVATLFQGSWGGLSIAYKLLVPAACAAALIVAGWSDDEGVKWRRWTLNIAAPAGVLALYLCLELVNGVIGISGSRLALLLVNGVTLAACCALLPWPARFSGAVGGLLLLNAYVAGSGGPALLTERTFFGVHRVQFTRDMGAVELMHGTTHHGCQLHVPGKELLPTSYYHPSGPVGEVFGLLNDVGRVHGVGVVGLGTGALATYAREGQEFTFYEIDPAIVRVAKNPEYFTFLRDVKGTVRCEVGDGRLLLEHATQTRHDVLVIDAFSSDSIPMHLMTVEAMKLYVDRLNTRGVVLMHTSNRHLRLDGVVVGNALKLGFAVRRRFDEIVTPEHAREAKSGSEWLAVARNPEDLAFLDGVPGWETSGPAWDKPKVWTDDYSNILSVFEAL